MTKDELDAKALALIQSYKENEYPDDLEALLVECVEMADDRDGFKIAVVALYKWTVEEARP